MTPEERELLIGADFSAPQTTAADGFEIVFYEAGSAPKGRPALIVLPGAGGPNLYNNGVRLLAQSRRVIVVELPGMGAIVNDRTQNAEQMAQTILLFADALGLDSFDLLGTSMGGVVAAWTAALGGDRIQHLVLEAPGAFRPDVNPSTFTPEQIQKAFHRHPERKRAHQVDPALGNRRWPLVERLMGPLHDDALAERLVDVTAPALVLFGTEDGLFGTEPARLYKQLIPRSNISLVYDAAHDIAGDRPEAFAVVVADFLERGTLFAVKNTSTLIYA